MAGQRPPSKTVVRHTDRCQVTVPVSLSPVAPTKTLKPLISVRARGIQSARLGESQSDRDPVSSATASKLQGGPQGPGKREEAQPLGGVPQLWAESSGWLPSKPPWACWPSAEQQSVFFCRCEGKSSVSCCPWGLRCPIEKKLRLQNSFLSSSSGLGAQPTQDSPLTLLLTAALPAVPQLPKCLIRCQPLSSGSFEAPCIFLLPAFAPLFPGCSCLAQVWTPEYHRDPGRFVLFCLQASNGLSIHLVSWNCKCPTGQRVSVRPSRWGPPSTLSHLGRAVPKETLPWRPALCP
ncbi:uncharacterized protein LOC122690359 [Cervus elaphus]|uniref:uncharacterized protein LOC122690359 n=1 Tax=Cervus elaphus TaxID=9860 RepID=UPI001CC32DC7|nr:uncharacterized protein LOC122690359 [Cervus elaphus]